MIQLPGFELSGLARIGASVALVVVVRSGASRHVWGRSHAELEAMPAPASAAATKRARRSRIARRASARLTPSSSGSEPCAAGEGALRSGRGRGIGSRWMARGNGGSVDGPVQPVGELVVDVLPEKGIGQASGTMAEHPDGGRAAASRWPRRHTPPQYRCR